MGSKNDELKFEDLPKVMVELIEEVNNLRSTVETLSDKIGERPRPALPIEVAAGIICKSKSTIYKLVAAGEIPYHKQGNRLYFFQDELMEWITSYKNKAEQAAQFRAAQDAAYEYIAKKRRKAYVLTKMDKNYNDAK